MGKTSQHHFQCLYMNQMSCPRAAAGLWHVCALCGLMKKHKKKKNYMKKDCCNLQCFKETNYKDNFRTKT